VVHANGCSQLIQLGSNVLQRRLALLAARTARQRLVPARDKGLTLGRHTVLPGLPWPAAGKGM
jgi:hypothetical protein